MKYYKIKYSKSAEKFLKRNKVIGIRFFKAFEDISTNIHTIKNYDIKKFHSKTYNDIFRLRIGSYRIIFRIIEDEILIFVVDIDSRGDIYK